MNCILRKWRLSDAKDLAAALSNDKILNNLRDGLPFLGRKKCKNMAFFHSLEERNFAAVIKLVESEIDYAEIG